MIMSKITRLNIIIVIIASVIIKIVNVIILMTIMNIHFKYKKHNMIFYIIRMNKIKMKNYKRKFKKNQNRIKYQSK